MTAWRGIQRDPNWVEGGVAKLISDFQGQPIIANTLRTLLRESKITDDAAIDVIEARYLATATDRHLDFLGQLVGEPRLGRSDAAFREAIRLRIRANVSQSTISDLYAIVMLAWAGQWTFHETPYGHYVVQMRDVPAALQGAIADVLSRIRPLGHQGEYVYTPGTAAKTIRFANEGAPGVRFYNAGQTGTSNRAAHVRRL